MLVEELNDNENENKKTPKIKIKEINISLMTNKTEERESFT